MMEINITSNVRLSRSLIAVVLGYLLVYVSGYLFINSILNL